MSFKYYSNNGPTYGAQIWRPERTTKWTLDLYFGNHVFVVMFYKVK